MGVPSYVPKSSSEFEAVCIDHVIGSSNLCCKPGSVVQCREFGHVQAAMDHFPVFGEFQFPLMRSTAPIP